MKLKGIFNKLFQKDNLVKTFFILCYTLFGIALLISGLILNSKYSTSFFERFELYAILNILFVALADVVFIVVILFNLKSPTDIQKNDLNLSLSYKKVRNTFMEQLEKHVVNDNPEYHVLERKNSRINKIILISIGIIVLLYIPLLIFQEEVVYYIHSFNLAETDFKFFYVIVIKITIDVLVLLMLVVWKLEKLKEQKDKVASLFPAFRVLQEKNLNILSIRTGNKAYPGKSMILRDEYNIDISNYSSSNRTLEEELLVMHELAKFIAYKNRNAKDFVFYVLFIMLSFLFSAFLFENYIVYFILFFLIFLVITLAASVYAQFREDYSNYAKWTLGFEVPENKSDSYSGVDHPLFDLDDLD